MNKIASLVKEYIELRDKKAAIAKIIELKNAILAKRIEELSIEMLAFLKETGQTSAKTVFGTASPKTKQSVKVNDAVKFFKFVKENDAFDLVTKNVAKTAYLQYKKDRIDVPGVVVDTFNTIEVRRA